MDPARDVGRPLDGGGIEVGRWFRIEQPRLPVLVWQVTDLEPGRSWTWTATSAGAKTDARHQVMPDGDAAAVVTQRIAQRGPLGIVIGVLMRRLMRGWASSLQPCTMIDDGVRCALECDCVRWGSHDLPPPAGIGVYERTPDGLLAAVRVYDDVEAPFERS